MPHSIITVSVVTALLPQISNYVIDKKIELVNESLIKTIKLIGVFTVPSAILMFAFGPLVANVLYFGVSVEDANYLGFVLSALLLV